MLTSLGPNIHITGLKQPEDGCAIAMKCPTCQRIEIAWSPYAKKPEDGGTMWVVQVPCYGHETRFWTVFPKSDPFSQSFHTTGWYTLPEVPNAN
jgi:hypothetical protein